MRNVNECLCIVLNTPASFVHIMADPMPFCSICSCGWLEQKFCRYFYFYNMIFVARKIVNKNSFIIIEKIN